MYCPTNGWKLRFMATKKKKVISERISHILAPQMNILNMVHLSVSSLIGMLQAA